MRFVLYGNGEVPYCTEVHHKRSLESLGHEVLLLQENRETTDRVLEESLRADGLIWVHTHSFKNLGTMSMDRVLKLLKLAGKPTIAVHLDLYMGLQRWNDYEDSAYMRVEHFFTVDKLMADWFNSNTDTKGHFLPAGVLEDECYISDQPSPYANDVIFVGSRSYHREWPWRPKLIDWLKATYGSRFTHVGRDGQTGVVRGDELNRLYANSKVAVGDTLCLNFDYPYYVSDRLFECAGRGNAAQVFPYIKGVDDWFTDGEHLRFFKFGDFEDLKANIDYLLEHDDEREKMGQAAHELVKANHTYRHRWQTILETVFVGARQ
jgi:glycosyltransferase involved in cell wall biosynthesis